MPVLDPLLERHPLRRMLLSSATTALLAASALPAVAHPTEALPPTAPTDVTHARTDNVDYLGRFPEHVGTAGGRLVGETFFITDGRGVHAYDVSEPASPDRLSSLLLPQGGAGAALAQEDVDTDGRILLVDAIDPDSGSTASRLRIVDVQDPEAMEVVSSLDVTDHTWTCVSEAGSDSCDYAYGRTGHIVDLTDPSSPTNLGHTWRERVGYGERSNRPYTHDLTQIAPGLTMTAGASSLLLDTRDPAEPRLLAELGDRNRFPSLGFHSVEWSAGGRDPIVVTGTEIAPNGSYAGTDCDDDANAVIETWDARALQAAITRFLDHDDASGFLEAGGFTRLGTFDAGGQGIFLDGQNPGHVLYCAHWMEQSPDWSDGQGRLAISYYDRGTRFVDVDGEGQMHEIGWMTAAEGYSGSPQWITDEIVYVMDYRRGLEVLRVTDEEASAVVTVSTDLIAANSDVGELFGEHGHLPWATVIPLSLGVAGLAAAIWRRRGGAVATA